MTRFPATIQKRHWRRTMTGRLHLWIAICSTLSFGATSAVAQPSASLSFYVPQAGSVGTPTQGALATRLFRACPNNEGGTSLPNNARIKIVLQNAAGQALANVAAADIYIKLNGGTAAQGFIGNGADSIVANSTYNPGHGCPLLQFLFADGPTNAFGETYITFTGANPSAPGVGVRSAGRKWG